MVRIFTDASVANGKGVSTCFILTDTNFLGYNTFTYESVRTSVEGELLGILNAIKYYNTLNCEDSEIIIYCDSIHAINLVADFEAGLTSTQIRIYNKILRELVEAKQMYPISLELIQGHQTTHNPNKVVDLISNSTLSFLNRKEC